MRTRVMRALGLGASTFLAAACSNGAGAAIAGAAAEETAPVPFAQYEQAVRETVACMRSAGYEVSEPKLSPTGRFLNYFYAVGGADSGGVAAQKKADEAYEHCYRAHEGRVVRAYALRTSLAPEELDRKVSELAACLRVQGVDVPEGASLEKIGALLDGKDEPAEKVCVPLYADYFVMPG